MCDDLNFDIYVNRHHLDFDHLKHFVNYLDFDSKLLYKLIDLLSVFIFESLVCSVTDKLQLK